MYAPHTIFHFLTSPEFRDILGNSFYKRHMESDDIASPFNNPEKILLLEWLIDHNYIIAEYRNNANADNESYLISTLGHAFIQNYRQSRWFRIRAFLHYTKGLYWILFASTLGSLIASWILHIFFS